MFPVPTESGTSSAAASTLETAEWAAERFFRTFFPRNQKSAKKGRQSTANMQSSRQPSTGDACEVECVEYGRVWWGRQWDPEWQWHCWCLVAEEGPWESPIIWRPPRAIGTGK